MDGERVGAEAEKGRWTHGVSGLAHAGARGPTSICFQKFCLVAKNSGLIYVVVIVFLGIAMETKECYACGKELLAEDFYVDNSREDGRQTKCKACVKKYMAERKKPPKKRENKTADRAAYERARYAANPEYYKEKQRRVIAKRKATHGLGIGDPKANCFTPRLKPEERKWRNAVKTRVSRALASGLLSKTPCEVCGELEVQGHHVDYDLPLQVVWLCDAHHRAVHGFRDL
jgi:hypothetical protein